MVIILPRDGEPRNNLPVGRSTRIGQQRNVDTDRTERQKQRKDRVVCAPETRMSRTFDL